MIWSVVGLDGRVYYEGRRSKMRRIQKEILKAGGHVELRPRRVEGRRWKKKAKSGIQQVRTLVRY